MDRDVRSTPAREAPEGAARASAAPGKSTLSEGGAAEEAPRAVPRLDLGKRDGGDGTAKPGGAGGPPDGKPDAPNRSGITVAVAAKAPGNPSASRTTVGVGEAMTFTGSGGGDWKAGGADIGSGDSVSWTAPDAASTVEISQAAKGGAPKKLPIHVIAPTGVDFKKVGDFPVAPAGVGMVAGVTASPGTVSFDACEWQEVGGAADDVDGYFKAYLATGQSLAHVPNAAWLPMGAIEDHAWTADKPKFDKPDGTKGYWPGRFGWSIPNKYRVGKNGDGQVFTTVRQSFAMDESGRITVTKGAASASAGAGGTMEGAAERYADMGQAHAMLNRQGSRTKAIMAVMQYNQSFGGKDPESAANLVKALTNEGVLLYVHIKCTNTYAWTTRDSVELKVTGTKEKGASFLINTDKNWEQKFPMAELYDFAKMNPSNALTIAATVEGSHALSSSLPFPFEGIKEAPMGGSDGRYLISAHLV